eukprot:1143619-Amphidinium_carterae.1
MIVARSRTFCQPLYSWTRRRCHMPHLAVASNANQAYIAIPQGMRLDNLNVSLDMFSDSKVSKMATVPLFSY